MSKTSTQNRLLLWVIVMGGLMTLFLLGVFSYILYEDVFLSVDQEPSTTTPKTKKDMNYYFMIALMLSLVAYLFLSVILCLFVSEKQTGKQVYTMLSCGRVAMVLKTTFLLFTTGAWFLYPYAKKKKSIPLFILLLVLLMPAFLIASILMSIMIIIPIRSYS